MSNFKDYARYYNLLYKEKDYVGESEYIRKLINTFAPDASEVLEVGCGTGIHASMLSSYGYKMTCIDKSEEMLEQARKHNSTADCFCADLQSFVLGRSVDVILALFHVLSYQITNEELMRAMENISRHMEAGGIFIFDCWYGPAVLTIRPDVRVKRCMENDLKITRIAEPSLDLERNSVDVKYQMFIDDSGLHSEVNEVHEMRYYFAPEIEMIANRFGMRVIHKEEWLTGKQPSDSSWGVLFVLEKNECEQ